MRVDLIFNDSGLLNVDPHIKNVNLEELYRYFVLRFPKSKTRHSLYRNFLCYVKCLQVFVKIHGVIVNGSYVTNKRDPNDIDISPVINGTDYLSIPEAHRQVVNILLDHNNRIAQKLHCHTYKPIFYYSPDDARNSQTVEGFNTALNFWSVSSFHDSKGILYVNLL